MQENLKLVPISTRQWRFMLVVFAAMCLVFLGVSGGSLAIVGLSAGGMAALVAIAIGWTALLRSVVRDADRRAMINRISAIVLSALTFAWMVFLRG